MANSILKWRYPFIQSNWKRGSVNVLSVSKFQEILDLERERVDRNNGTFSLVSFNAHGIKDVNNDDFQEIIKVIKSRKLRRVDKFGLCCGFRIGVMLYNTGAKGAEYYAKCIIDELKKRIPDIDCTIYTYPDDFKHRNGDKRSTNGFRSNDTQEDFQKTSRDASYTKYVEEKELVLDENVSLTPLRVCSSKVLKVKGSLNIKAAIGKRIVDIVGSTLLILLFSPVMLATAVAIKLTSHGPIVFKQQRAGVCGNPFTLYKFRSMVIDAEEKKSELFRHNLRTGPVFKMENDPRVTHIGRIIRKWSVDEMPQFFNVLKGDMSLVGPRPPTMDEVAKYFNWHNRRFDIKPGITCIWQVYARHNKCFEGWVRLDIKYIRSQSFLLDLKILFLTIPAVVLRKGAH